MTLEILFLGLNTVGTSIALALAETELDVRCVGFDSDPELAKRARELRAVTETVSHPRGVSQTADLVVVDLPVLDMPAYLEMLASRIKPESVVLDTTPARSASVRFVTQNFPSDRFYIGATAIVGPSALFEDPQVPQAPHADLYNRGLLALTILPNTSKDALQIATNLAHVLGASPFFIEAAEHDGVYASIEGLPLLMSAALMRSTASSLAWREIQRMGGETFATSTKLGCQGDVQDLARSLALNREKLALKVDALTEELDALRSVLEQEDEAALVNYLAQASQARQTWERARHSGDWATQEYPHKDVHKGGGFLRSLIGFGPPARKDPE